MSRPLSELTNDELARLILRQLWQFQDASGVSMGRSLRSALLEAAMELLPLPHDPDAFTPFDLYSEAALASRRVTMTLSEQTSFPGISFVTDRELAIMILGRLWRWYESDTEENPERSFSNEQNILGRALALLPMLRDDFTQEDLIREEDERQHVRFDIKSDESDEKIEMIR